VHDSFFCEWLVLFVHESFFFVSDSFFFFTANFFARLIFRERDTLTHGNELEKLIVFSYASQVTLDGKYNWCFLCVRPLEQLWKRKKSISI
jgi:hypothetical protein